MTIFKRLMYYVQFLFKGKRQMFSLLDKESTLYYERCENLQGKEKEIIYSLIVTNISCEIYEQVIYGFKYLLQDEYFDINLVKNMYRTCLMYFFIKFNAQFSAEFKGLEECDIAQIGRLRPKEKKLMDNLSSVMAVNCDKFELDFIKYFSKAVFNQKILNPYTVALSVNILYNSYERFIEDYCFYIRHINIA